MSQVTTHERIMPFRIKRQHSLEQKRTASKLPKTKPAIPHESGAENEPGRYELLVFLKPCLQNTKARRKVRTVLCVSLERSHCFEVIAPDTAPMRYPCEPSYAGQ